jgi:hypothetical protein
MGGITMGLLTEEPHFTICMWDGYSVERNNRLLCSPRRTAI